MVRYCDGDIPPLQGIYLEMRPYMKNHPYLRTFDYGVSCNKKECEGSGLIKDGFKRTKEGIFQKLRCVGCGDPLIGEKK